VAQRYATCLRDLGQVESYDCLYCGPILANSVGLRFGLELREFRSSERVAARVTSPQRFDQGIDTAVERVCCEEEISCTKPNSVFWLRLAGC
jgi:hypothetical protein